MPEFNCVFVNILSRLVQANQTFLWVDFALELEHFLCVFEVDCMSIVLQVLEGHCEAGLDVNFGAIDAAEERSNHSLLFVWSPHVVVKDVRDDGGVNTARERLGV